LTDDPTDFLGGALSIGRRLCRDAVWSKGRCGWLGWAIEPHGGQWVSVHRALGSLLYDGSAGIGLFLARLAQLSGDPIVRATAEGALAQSLSACTALETGGEYGFYSGLSGVAWACGEGGHALGHDGLVKRADGIMRSAARLPPRSDRLDIVNGSAGLILALVAAARRNADKDLLASAVRHGEHLIAFATRNGSSWSWDTLGTPGERHLLGLAHGASGIALALAKLGAATGRNEFLAAAKAAIAYERGHFRPAEGNWPDLRSFVQPGPTGEPPSMLAWCHGAPGIGLARLALIPLLPDEAGIRDEAETAIRTTAANLAAGGTGNFSLCHGDGGNAELLIVAAETFARPNLLKVARATAAGALHRFESSRAPWPCGVPGAGETPNLMLGTAGIGHFLLRLHDPRGVNTPLLPGAAYPSAEGRLTWHRPG
jgi:lantibiotic modifying enzyme